MNALFGIEAIRRVGNGIRCRLQSMAILTIGALFMLGAVGLAVAGGYLWLATLMASHLAALAVAGGLFLTGAVIIAFASRRCGRPEATPAPAANKAEADVEVMAEQLIRSAIGGAAVSPYKMVFGAIALGVAVGLMRANKSP